MIIIRNRQRTVPVNIAALQRDAELILTKLGYATHELTVVITNNTTMRRYNREFRAVDKGTDILSFPYNEPDSQFTGDHPVADEEPILGDILISAPYVQAAAVKLGVTFEERMRELLVHGIFHLLGYDHETDADFEKMHAQEQKMLNYLRQCDTQT